ncbi:hypothetical protein P308_20070 [Pseudomonas piscis]|nr:hypothetical protein P308_20070 [Pseudomonas piscis]
MRASVFQQSGPIEALFVIYQRKQWGLTPHLPQLLLYG